MLDGEARKRLACNYCEWEMTNMFYNFTLDGGWRKTVHDPHF